jgi:hypothetical protein
MAELHIRLEEESKSSGILVTMLLQLYCSGPY